MGMVFGEYYSAAISDNVKRKIDQKLYDGEWPGKAPIGYLNITKPDGTKDIIPDPVKTTQHLYINRDKYCDVMGKNMTDDKDLMCYILNIYKVLCTRGIYGTYIFACDKGLRDYLKQFLITE